MRERAEGRCPRCLRRRPGNEDPRFGLSFAPPCEHCGYRFIPERLPKLIAWVCPYCMKQYSEPDGHHMAGDDRATSCFHALPGERGVTQPRLVRIEVEPKVPFEPRPIPGDRPPIADSSQPLGAPPSAKVAAPSGPPRGAAADSSREAS